MKKIINKMKKIRYGVVGLGHIAQAAVLPSFANAYENSELTALISGDAQKLKKLGKKYDVPLTYSYEQYEKCLDSGEIDAVYIALPNHLHCEYTLKAAERGIHVLCEKPMAVTAQECKSMIGASQKNKIKLMIAYRLHFEESNMEAVQMIKSGKIGEPRIFNSVFSMQVKDENIRVKASKGGGTLYDIGIYCINAARYLFQDEPLAVVAMSANNGEKRFEEIDEMTSVILYYPHERLATFTSSFGAADVSSYRIVGTKGDLQVEPAYEYVEKLTHHLTIKDKKEKKVFEKRDQFSAQLIYFSNCILKNKEPEPSGIEGLSDVKIIEAIYQSAQSHRPVHLKDLQKEEMPTLQQEIQKPPVRKPIEFRVESPHT